MTRTKDRRIDPTTSAGDKTMAMVGVIAALVVMLLINVLAARHYRRWDMTVSKLYTLSEATKQTLDTMEQDVDVNVMLSNTDPLRQSIDDLLTIYNGHTTRLHVHYVDPDRHPAAFAAMQQRYGIIAGRTQDGRVIADTAVVVASGDKHWFITPGDMTQEQEQDRGYAKSRIEQALTVGIRSVLDPKRVMVCFASGHGEFSADDISNRGFSEVRQRLVKDNDDTQVIDLTKRELDAKLDKCDALIIASPSAPYEPALVQTLTAAAEKGLDMMLLLGAISDAEHKRLLATGFEKLANKYGARINGDVVFEQDAAMVVPRGAGEVFLPEIKSHAITKALLGPAAAIASMRVVLQQTRSFDIIDPALARPLLATSDQAFGMIDYYDWVKTGGDPKAGAASLKGPRTVGVAAVTGAAPKESRLVLFGTPAVAWNENFRNPSRHGNALLIDSTLSWLTSKPPIVDVPAKVAPSANLHLTEESLAEILRYVLLFMPLAALLIGIAVRMRRANKSRQRDKHTPAPGSSES